METKPLVARETRRRAGSRKPSERQQLVLLLVLWLALVIPLTSHLAPASALDSRANRALGMGAGGDLFPYRLRAELCRSVSAAATAEALNARLAGATEPSAYADDLGSLLCLLNAEGGSREAADTFLRSLDSFSDRTDVPVGGSLHTLAAVGSVAGMAGALAPQSAPRPLFPPPRATV